MTQTQHYTWAIIGAGLTATGGIALAVAIPVFDGGWGGALTVFFGLWVTFSRRQHGKVARNNYLELQKDKAPQSLDDLNRKADIIKEQVDDDSNKRQSIAAAIILTLGTLIWAFGEFIANLFLLP